MLLHAREEVDPFATGSCISGVVKVHQQEIVGATRDRIDDGFGRGDGLHRDAFPLEEEVKCIEQVALIVGDQNPRLNRGGGSHD